MYYKIMIMFKPVNKAFHVFAIELVHLEIIYTYEGFNYCN